MSKHDTKTKVTVFDKIAELGLENKIINSALNRAQVPNSLRDDASQDIRTAWFRAYTNDSYTDSEVAGYAHKIATNEAFRTRRNLGSAVKLPDRVFARNKEGENLVEPGHLASTVDIDEMTDWLDFNGQLFNLQSDDDESEIRFKYFELDKDAIKQFDKSIFTDFQYKILKLYCKGLKTRRIAGILKRPEKCILRAYSSIANRIEEYKEKMESESA